MTSIPIERAYKEACAALGEAIVMQRLLHAELQERDQDIEKENNDN